MGLGVGGRGVRAKVKPASIHPLALRGNEIKYIFEAPSLKKIPSASNGLNSSTGTLISENSAFPFCSGSLFKRAGKNDNLTRFIMGFFFFLFLKN